MNAAEFTCTREGLGLSVIWMSQWLEVPEKTVRQWENGRRPVPAGVADALANLDGLTFSMVRTMTRTGCGARDSWTTFRNDADFREGGVGHFAYAPPSSAEGQAKHLPASWHRAYTQRCFRESGGTIVYYVPKVDRT